MGQVKHEEQGTIGKAEDAYENYTEWAKAIQDVLRRAPEGATIFAAFEAPESEKEALESDCIISLAGSGADIVTLLLNMFATQESIFEITKEAVKMVDKLSNPLLQLMQSLAGKPGFEVAEDEDQEDMKQAVAEATANTETPNA